MKISSYLPKPFQMEVSPDLTITSPVPSVATGKILAGFQELQREQARRVAAGEPQIHADEAEIPGWPETTEGLARMILGDAEWERLVTLGTPELFISQASMCAVIYWVNGGSEEAVQIYLEATSGKTPAPAAPKGNRAQRRSKNGQHSA